MKHENKGENIKNWNIFLRSNVTECVCAARKQIYLN